jgi:glycosyltransferase involved in cell wall biosynthesis
VIVTGRVPDVLPHLERAAALVVPLRIGGGTRLKIVEALALATPVVSTRVGAEGLGLADGRHLRLAEEPIAFAEAIGALLEDPREAAAMGRRGRDFVHERYRWAALGEELVDYWERVRFSGALSPSR